MNTQAMDRYEGKVIQLPLKTTEDGGISMYEGHGLFPFDMKNGELSFYPEGGETYTDQVVMTHSDGSIVIIKRNQGESFLKQIIEYLKTGSQLTNGVLKETELVEIRTNLMAGYAIEMKGPFERKYK